MHLTFEGKMNLSRGFFGNLGNLGRSTGVRSHESEKPMRVNHFMSSFVCRRVGTYDVKACSVIGLVIDHQVSYTLVTPTFYLSLERCWRYPTIKDCPYRLPSSNLCALRLDSSGAVQFAIHVFGILTYVTALAE